MQCSGMAASGLAGFERWGCVGRGVRRVGLSDSAGDCGDGLALVGEPLGVTGAVTDRGGDVATDTDRERGGV